jgi:YVTN family beta-propeller protein
MRLALTAFILSMLWTGVASAQPFAYITNEGSNSVSVIDTATNMEVDTVTVGNEPIALGKFIQPPPPINTPTLSEWGLITMAGLLGIVGFMVIRRRKGTA